MALFTNFPGQNPFHGGIIDTWGTGLHEDFDPVTREKETTRADYLNRIELRIQRGERIINQLEHELLYPSGSIATSGVAESIPSSGNFYVRSRIDVLASGLNRVIELLELGGTIPVDSVNFHPFHVGNV